MNFKIISFAGKAQAGKTTAKEIVKEILEEDGEYKFQSVSFAQKLKEIAFDLFGWNGDKEIYYPMNTKGLSIEELNTPVPDTGRQLLINIGQKMREIRPTVWADSVYNIIKEDVDTGLAGNKIYVIDDMRFKNEVDALSKFNEKLLMIKINRNNALDLDDVSEKDLDGFSKYDYVIDNNGSKEDLKKSLVTVINHALLVHKAKK